MTCQFKQGVRNLKKHLDRPALWAVDVARWASRGILKLKRVKRTAIFFLSEGKNVRQTWFHRTLKRKRVRNKTATTYLAKGIFLVPRWRAVPDWEIEYLKARQKDLRVRGIIFIRDGYYRLTFQNVDDLDHASRMQDHILDNYLDMEFLREHLPELMRILAAQDKIISKIVTSKIGVESVQISIRRNLSRLRRNLRSIFENAPLFTRDYTAKDARTVIAGIRIIARECREYPFRPIGRRLYYAAQSLERAAINIRRDRIDLAKNNIKSALRNLEYPEEPTT